MIQEELINLTDNIVTIDGKQYKEDIRYINGHKITNQYPIMSEEERLKKRKEALYKLYRYFTDK